MSTLKHPARYLCKQTTDYSERKCLNSLMVFICTYRRHLLHHYPYPLSVLQIGLVLLLLFHFSSGEILSCLWSNLYYLVSTNVILVLFCLQNFLLYFVLLGNMENYRSLTFILISHFLSVAFFSAFPFLRLRLTFANSRTVCFRSALLFLQSSLQFLFSMFSHVFVFLHCRYVFVQVWI